MDFSIKTFDAKNTIAAAKTGCIAVGVFENKKLSQAALALDHKGEITAALKSGDISGNPGSTLLMRRINGAAAERILLVGLGKEEPIVEKDLSSALQSVARTFPSLGASDAIIALVEPRHVAELRRRHRRDHRAPIRQGKRTRCGLGRSRRRARRA